MTDQPARALRIAVIAGEESGDLLGADLIDALAVATHAPVNLIGVGGRNLTARGLVSMFDAGDIALMGLTAVLRDLPRLARRIGHVARAIANAKPDCLVTIDSPDFALRVARKLRALDPSIPIVHYVCPSVWAWRPGRAPAMRPYIDDILCLLPFEPAALRRLDGPSGHFVGHRLSRDPHTRRAADQQIAKGAPDAAAPRHLLVLPGSRRGEVKALLPAFGETIAHLAKRGTPFRVTIPTVPHVAAMVEEGTADWAVRPDIVTDDEAKWQAFGAADAALACSGTVTLELALARVPTVVCYKTDMLGMLLTRLVTVWSAALPNLIADWPVVPEHFNQYVRPAYLARQLSQLWSDTMVRQAQLGGFDEIAKAMHTDLPAGEKAAAIVLARIRSHVVQQ